MLWFASGIVMMYTGGMPLLTPRERLDGLAPIDLSQVRLTPGEAAAGAGIRAAPGRAELLTVLGRPAYRFDGATVFGDTGSLLAPVGIQTARSVASHFSGAPAAAISHVGLVEQPDQWTIYDRSVLPAHRFRVDDGAGTELYVSRRTAEVGMVTTRRERVLAWLGAIPHWFYLPRLRVDRPRWEAVIVWTSAVGCLITATGLLLGLTRFRWRRVRRAAHPYAGLMWWHGSSASHADLGQRPVVGAAVRLDDRAGCGALGGGPPRPGGLDDRPGSAHKEVYAASTYEVHLAGDTAVAGRFERLLLDADTLVPRAPSPDVAALAARLQAAIPNVAVTDAAWLEAYDAYYYGRGADGPPLPVIRVRFADPLETWVYIDPADLRVAESVHRYSRLERWLFNGLHSLDFAFWYDRRPLWDIGLIALSLGGLASSGIGLWVGAGRISRAVRRGLRRAATAYD